MLSIRVCSIEDCQGAVSAKGLCSVHYNRLRRHGDPLGGRVRKNRPKGMTYSQIYEWIKEHSTHGKGAHSDCIEMEAIANNQGYPQIRFRGKCVVLTHLIFEVLYKRPLKEGCMICHHCDNPKCINPSHFYEGTAKSNSDDMMSRGRQVPNKRAFTQQEADDIRMLYSQKISMRRLAQRFGVSTSTIWYVIHRRGVYR